MCRCECEWIASGKPDDQIERDRDEMRENKKDEAKKEQDDRASRNAVSQLEIILWRFGF